MRKNINLLYSREQYTKRLKVQKILRLGAFAVGFVVLVTISIVYFLNSESKSQLSKLTSQKEIYLQKNINNSDSIAQINSLADKLELIRNVYASERDYETHVKVLEELIPTSTSSGLINNISFTGEAGVEFDIQFSDYSEAYAFLRLIESEDVNSLFTNISIHNTSITELNGTQIDINFSAEYKKYEK